MVDQRHDVICRLAAAGAARPGRLRTALAHAMSPARYAVAGLLVAFAALLTLPLQAEAQTVETLVNNLSQSTAAQASVGGDNNIRQAQKFTVPAGQNYTLADVTIGVGFLGNDRIVVTIREGSGTNPPNTALYTLIAPASPGTGNQVYSAPADAVLEAGNSYFVMLARAQSNGSGSQIRTTDANSQSGKTGWTIDDARRERSGSSWSDDTDALKIRIRGSVFSTNAAPIFTDGTSTPRDFNETIGDATVTTASNIGAPVAATDTDTGDTLSYSFDGGTDDARFGIITTTGQIQTKIGENYSYEAKASYAVRVKVEDGNSGSDTIDVTLNVTDQDEAPLRPVAPTVKGHNQTTKLVVSMTAPQNTDRPPITGYKIRIHRPGYVWYEFEWVTTKNLTQIVGGASSGRRYGVQYRARNDEGQGPWSPQGYSSTRAHATGKPKIFGTARVGRTLTVGTSDISDGNGNSKAEDGEAGFAYTYQWMRSVSGTDTDISGATLSTYTLTAADEGNTVKVKASFTDNAGYAEGPLTSNAYPSTGTVLAALTDATLSALTVNDGTGDLALSPAFAPGTFVYEAEVGNAVTTVTLSATVNHAGASVSGVTLGGTAIADSDFTDGITVPSLVVGDNAIVVTVTAEDTTTTETYTVVVTRAAGTLTATLESPDYVVVENLQYRFDLKLTEAVAIPLRDVRDHAFSVTNGRMVKAKRIHMSAGGSNHWRMTVEPYDETKPVTVTLRGNRACSEQGALCTGGGDHVTNSPTLTLSADTLTLDSSNLPSVSIENATARENDAWLSFTVKLSRKAAQTVAVDFKTVSGGTATEGADYRAQDYRVVFTPGETSIEAGVALIADTVDDVGETVKAEIANARVITARGAELGPLTIATAQATGTIDAPATSTTDVSNLTIRIDDTTGDEDDGWLDFRVSLSRAYTEYVCFDFETLTTGTATEGTDYGKRPKVNDWIRPGATQTTAFVRIIDDSVSDSGETVKVRIGNARLCDDASKTVTIANAEATGTITNSDHIPQAWLARFGRTVADQVIDAVDGRLGAARRPGVEATLAGRSIAGAPEGDGTRQSMAEDAASRIRLEALSNWLRGDTGESRVGLSGSQVVSERDLLAATAFSMTGRAEGGGSVAVWGRGAIASFDGRESRLSVDGEVANVMLGADWSGGALTAGLMLSHARGSGSYRGESDGKVESTLTGIYPYGRYAASERVTVWGVAGYGAGSLTLKQEDVAATETDMDLMMAAVGLRGVAMKAPESGGPELAVKSDAMVVRTTSDAVQGLEATTAEVTRLRLGLEGSWRVVAGGGGEFVPRLEIGVRHDGGDAETGFGVDIGGGLAWSDRASGIGAEVSGRALLTHASGGFREHGFAGSLTWDPTPDLERGLKLTLRQSVGAEANEGVDALLSRGTMAGLAANDNGDGRRRREVKFGYGFGMFEGRFTATPEIGLGLSEAGRDYSLGWRLTRAGSGAGSLDLSVEARRRESANDDVPPEHGIGFAATARW